MAPLADLGAYLSRIGLGPGATFPEIHRAHVTSIPFENLESYSGRSVPLDLAALEDKFVARRRGGYCFEHNLVLSAALESLGVDEVVPLLARVRIGPEGAPRPLNHLLLHVVVDGTPWLADVGFGGGGLLDPLPFQEGAESDQCGWRYRLARDGAELVLQVFQDEAWTDLYGFVPEPVQLVDIEVSNWFTATHPASPFVTGVIAGARHIDRCLSMFVSDQAVLVERAQGEGSTITEIGIDDAPTILAERFGLGGVTVGPDRRLSTEAPAR